MTNPALSVVIASHDSSASIARCLDALRRQSDPIALQIVVADSSTDGTDDIVRTRFPEVELLHFDPSMTIPELRGRGIAVARASIIAVLDPYSIVDGDWAAAVLRAHAAGRFSVIGGSVELALSERNSHWRWTQFFNEYGLFMPPIADGPVALVPGSNVSYRREVLFDGPTPRYPVFWKTFVNWNAAAESGPPGLDGRIRVQLLKPVRFSDFLASRFSHGRCFAAMRVAGASRSARIGRALTAPLVPGLLLWRWSAGILAKRRHALRYVATLPAQLLLFTSWGIGEFTGYAFGTGDSCRRLFY